MEEKDEKKHSYRDEGGGVSVRWKGNSISSPSSEMGDTVKTRLPHPKQNRTRSECIC